MTDDLQWFWASESGRDRILRDEVEGLHARLSSASAQTSRLSSQLANLSGSIESRLNALSRAFDAYVELGDVREDLAAYEEPAAVRRDVMAAIAALAGGRAAAPVDPRDLDYWLPYATNAVIALVGGEPAGDALDRARALAPESELFVVAACGALGRGPSVVGLLPAVLTGDQELTEHQRVVWRAAVAGAFGDLGDDLAAAWRPLLDREPVAGWSAWVHSHAPSPTAGISWLHALVTDPSSLHHPADENSSTPSDDALLRGFAPSPVDRPAADQPVASPRDGLRGVVSELVGRGMPAEAELLRRSRELRALIEEPNPRPTTDVEPATVLSEVRRALVLPSTSASVRASLLSWVAPALVGVVDQLTAAAKAAPTTQETVRSGGGAVVVVSPAGADPTAVAAGVARLQAAYRVSNSRLIGWSAGTGIAALLTLVFALVGSGWGWLFAIATIVGVAGTVRQIQARRATHRAGAEAIQRFQDDIAEATARVNGSEQKRAARLVQLTGEAADLRARLAPPVQTAPVQTAPVQTAPVQTAPVQPAAARPTPARSQRLSPADGR